MLGRGHFETGSCSVLLVLLVLLGVTKVPDVTLFPPILFQFCGILGDILWALKHNMWVYHTRVTTRCATLGQFGSPCKRIAKIADFGRVAQSISTGY